MARRWLDRRKNTIATRKIVLPRLPMGGDPHVSVAFLAGYQTLMWWKLRTVQRRSMEAHASAQWDQLAQLATIWLDWSPGDAQATLFAAIAAENRNSTLQALQLYEAVPADAPLAYSRARTRLAQLAFAADSPRDVESYLTAAIESDPTNPLARSERLRYLGITFQQTRARAEALAAIRAQADSPSAYVYLVATDLVTYRGGEATTARWAAEASEPELFAVASFMHAVKQESLAETSAPAENPASAQSPSSALDTNSSSSSQVPASSTATLEQRFADLNQRYPNNLDLRFYQMERALESGDRAALKQSLASLPSSAADDPRAWRLRGQWLQLEDRLQDAWAAYQTAIEKNPYDTRPYQFQSEIARLQGNEDEAKRLQQIAATGNQMRRVIYAHQSIDQLDVTAFNAMAEFAELVKQPEVAQQIKRRMQSMAQSSTQPTTTP